MLNASVKAEVGVLRTVFRCQIAAKSRKLRKPHFSWKAEFHDPSL
jgi:hypothetical protein